jgi:hypothetical protein
MAMMKGHHFPGGKSVMPKVSDAPAKKNMVESVSIRPIKNGFIVEKSSYSTGPGPYKSTSETIFSPTKPKLGV